MFATKFGKSICYHLEWEAVIREIIISNPLSTDVLYLILIGSQSKGLTFPIIRQCL